MLSKPLDMVNNSISKMIQIQKDLKTNWFQPTIELSDDPKEDNSDAASSSGLLQLIPDAISAGMEVLIDGLKRKYANMFLSTGLVNNQVRTKFCWFEEMSYI